MLQGIGPQTAQQVIAAARQIAKSVADDLRFRIDLDPHNVNSTLLITHLHRLLKHDEMMGAGAERITEAANYLAPLAHLPTGPAVTVIVPANTTQPDDMVGEVRKWLTWADANGIAHLTATGTQPLHASASPDEVWKDFERRSAEYYGLLGEIVDLKLDVAAAEGNLPVEIVERVHQQELDDTHRRVSLRG
jgi:hypothetical protein